MSTRLAIRAFILWPLSQVIRLLLFGGIAVMEALAPSCVCSFRIRMRNQWTRFSVEAWKSGRVGGLAFGANLAGASAYATAICGDWGEAASSPARAVHGHARPPGDGGPDGDAGI